MVGGRVVVVVGGACVVVAAVVLVFPCVVVTGKVGKRVVIMVWFLIPSDVGVKVVIGDVVVVVVVVTMLLVS